jgi:enoyl-CoA hydratase
MFAIEPHGSVRVLRMDDGKVNALSPAFLDGFAKAWGDAGDHAIVLAGNAKAFGAGLDLHGLVAMKPEQALDFTRRFMQTFRAVLAHPRPVVAAVDRAAIAGGAVLALACDFRLATPSAKMGVTEVPVGVPFPEPVLRLVEHRLPAHEHAEALLRGAVRVGTELETRGWVDRVVDQAVLINDSIALATELAAMSPLAYATSEMRNRAVVHAFDTFDAAPWAKALEHPDTRAALARTLERLAKR